MTLNDAQIAGLCETFRIRAETYTRKAKEAHRDPYVAMFTAFASTLEWAEREVRATVRLAALSKTNVDQVTRERMLADAAHDAEDSQP